MESNRKKVNLIVVCLIWPGHDSVNRIPIIWLRMIWLAPWFLIVHPFFLQQLSQVYTCWRKDLQFTKHLRNAKVLGLVRWHLFHLMTHNVKYTTFCWKSMVSTCARCDRNFGLNHFCLEKWLRHRNAARAWKKSWNFFQARNCVVRSHWHWSWLLMEFIFLLTNSVEALLEKVRSQRVQVETNIDRWLVYFSGSL